VVRRTVNERVIETVAHIDALILADADAGCNRPVAEVELRPDWGVVGDKHAGPGDRQLLIFARDAREAIDAAAAPGLCYGRFRENLLVDGLDPGDLRPGDVLMIGATRLRITAATKRCFPECTLALSECRIRAHLAFAAVITGGRVRRGDEIRLA
jgi:MOSC domain-containing protein YiiM